MTIADKIYEKLRQADPETIRAVLEFLEFLESKKAAKSQTDRQGWDATFGLLRDANIFDGDPIVIQQKMRDEWN